MQIKTTTRKPATKLALIDLKVVFMLEKYKKEQNRKLFLNLEMIMM
jgi:hypothetical protein